MSSAQHEHTTSMFLDARFASGIVARQRVWHDGFEKSCVVFVVFVLCPPCHCVGSWLACYCLLCFEESSIRTNTLRTQIMAVARPCMGEFCSRCNALALGLEKALVTLGVHVARGVGLADGDSQASPPSRNERVRLFDGLLAVARKHNAVDVSALVSRNPRVAKPYPSQCF